MTTAQLLGDDKEFETFGDAIELFLRRAELAITKVGEIQYQPNNHGRKLEVETTHDNGQVYKFNLSLSGHDITVDYNLHFITYDREADEAGNYYGVWQKSGVLGARDWDD